MSNKLKSRVPTSWIVFLSVCIVLAALSLLTDWLDQMPFWGKLVTALGIYVVYAFADLVRRIPGGSESSD